jgi:ankyrin repeat protein
LVEQSLQVDPGLLDSYSPEGFTLVALAAHFGQLETLELLIARGANVNAVSRHAMNVTPLHAALFGLRVEAARMLILAGADVTPARGGSGAPRAGWTALHYCAAQGFVELVELLVEHGADINAQDEQGKTPLTIALESAQPVVADLLLEIKNTREERT